MSSVEILFFPRIFLILSFPWIFEMAHYAYKNDGGDIGEVLSVLGDTWCLVSVT